jgi:hypothetical protein
MKFIEAAVESSRADGRWVDAQLPPAAATVMAPHC